MTLDIERSGRILGPFRASLESEQRVARFFFVREIFWYAVLS